TANERSNSSPRLWTWPVWTWPAEAELVFRPKGWRSSSPADVDKLTDGIARYIERPWLQHNIIDGAAINAFLFSALASSMEAYKTGELLGKVNWSYVLSNGNPLWMLGFKIGGFLLRWVMLPAIAVALMATDNDKAGEFVLGLW